MRCFKLPLVFFGSWFFPFLAVAQYNPGFVATRAVPVGGTPWAFATADLNHDGVQDVVIADGATTTLDAGGVSHTTINGIAVLIGKGGGAFRTAAHYATSDSASFVALADVDGNGSPDVVTASDDPLLDSPGGSVSVLKNNGNGTFGAAAKYSFPGWIATAVYPGDLNGDGHVDLTVALTSISSGESATQILLNNGDGTFRLGTLTIGSLPVAVADFNGDGKLSVAAISNRNSTQASFGVMQRPGTDQAAVRGLTTIPPVGSDTVTTVGDFNGDGYPDLLLASRKSTEATLLLNNRAGSFTAAAFPFGFTPTGAASGDFNHDGITDVALIDTQAELFVQFGRADGTFSYPVQYDTSGTGVLGAFALQAVDLNNDGILDLATTTPTGSFVPIFGKPGGTFNAGTEVSLLPGLISDGAVTADFNNDGIPDIAELHVNGAALTPQPPVDVFLGDGTGRFKLSTATPDTGFAASMMAAKDVNHDGIVDLVFMNAVDARNNAELAVLLGKGDGTFGPPQYSDTVPPLNSAPPSSPLYLADVNNDGKPDAITVFGVHLGNGDGTFGPAIPLPDFYNLFALGDFNNDGKLDIVTLTDDRQPIVTIYEGDGTGRFPAAVYSDTMPFGDFGNNLVAVGRFTRNGNLGVVVGSAEQFYPDITTLGNGAFSVLAGNGNGTLKAPVVYQVPFGLRSFAIGDFNDDGVDDVGAFNGVFAPNQGRPESYVTYSAREISVFTAEGDGTFLPPAHLGAGNVTSPAVVADFNRDGAVDIAASSRDAVEVLMNSRGTSLSLTATPATGAAGTSVSLKCAVTASFRFSGSLSGRVVFFDGTTTLGTADLVNGVATLSVSTLGKGSHSLIASFQGNGNYNAHRSKAVTVVVAP